MKYQISNKILDIFSLRFKNLKINIIIIQKFCFIINEEKIFIYENEHLIN
jgi:hypothetical protein